MIQKKERGAGSETRFAVEIWEADQVLVREPVSRADLIFARDETWIHGLRTGFIASASFFFLNHGSLLHEFQTPVRAAPNVQDQTRHDRIMPGQPSPYPR